MIKINLLPVREIKKRARARSQIKFFSLAFLALLLSLGVLFWFFNSKTSRLNDDIARLKLEKQQYAKILRQIKKINKDKKVLETQISVIKQLKKTSSLTVHVLDEIANLTPTDRMWLTSLTQKGSSLQITGMGLDNRTIAGYMEKLETSPYIQSVDLSNSSLQDYAGRNLKSFSLSCTVGVPDKEKDKEEKVKE